MTRSAQKATLHKNSPVREKKATGCNKDKQIRGLAVNWAESSKQRVRGVEDLCKGQQSSSAAGSAITGLYNKAKY
jgi:hypothetical protein